MVHDHPKAALPEGGKARRVYLLLRDEIVQGVFAPMSLLPGETRLAEHYDVSRVTIRRALDTLASEGLIDRHAGRGTTVVARAHGPQSVGADITTLIPQLVEMGQSTTARLLSFAYGAPSEAVASAMGLTAGMRVQTAVRVRSADGQPFSHLTTHVPESIANNYSEADLASTPLLRLLERGGVNIGGADQSVTATLASPDVAAALDVSVGAPLLSLTRIVRDASGQGVEYLAALYRPDLFRLEMSLARVGHGPQRHWEPVVGGVDARTRAAE